MSMLFRVCDFGTSFATRARGAEVREAFEHAADGQAAVEVDFTAVTNVTYSFADEFIGKLTSCERDAPHISLVNMAPSIEPTVRRAQERRASVAC